MFIDNLLIFNKVSRLLFFITRKGRNVLISLFFIFFFLFISFFHVKLLSENNQSQSPKIVSLIGLNISEKYLYYNEVNMVKFFGFLTGVDFSLETILPFGFYFSLQSSAHMGKTNYDGFYTTTNSNVRVAEHRKCSDNSKLFYLDGKLGYAFPIAQSLIFVPSIGLGYRMYDVKWKEDDQVSNATKSRRSTNGDYFLGAGVYFRLSPRYILSQDFYLGRSFSASVSYKNYPLDNIKINNLYVDNGLFFASYSRAHLISKDNFSLTLNFIYRYLSLGKSKTVPIYEIMRTMNEPESYSYDLSIGLGVSYTFF